MKKLLSILFITNFLYGVSVNAQAPGWSVLNSGTTNDLLGVSVISDSIAFASGSHGQIIKTTNGGSTWINESSGTTKSIYTINFTGPLQGIAAGDSGTFLRTTDGGTTWTPLFLDSVISFRNIYFLNNTIGYAVGSISGVSGHIFQTADGGATWNPQNINSTNGIYGISFTSPMNGSCVNIQGLIFNTNDGGMTWNSVSSGVTSQLCDISFTSSSEGCIVGDNGAIFHTADSGSTWNSVNSGVADFLCAISFKDAVNGFIAGGNVNLNRGRLLQTNDGGLSWVAYPTLTSRLMNIDMARSTGYAVGLNGLIMKHDLSTGISEYPGPEKLSIAYRSETSIVTIRNEKIQNGNVLLEIFDLNGAKVFSDNVIPYEGKISIRVPQLVNGNYSARIIQGKVVFAGRFSNIE